MRCFPDKPLHLCNHSKVGVGSVYCHFTDEEMENRLSRQVQGLRASPFPYTQGRKQGVPQGKGVQM